jgi:hypothetical protein
MENVHLTSGYKDVLHDGGEYEVSDSMVPSLAYARREGKEGKSRLFGGVKFLSTFVFYALVRTRLNCLQVKEPRLDLMSIQNGCQPYVRRLRIRMAPSTCFGFF